MPWTVRTIGLTLAVCLIVGVSPSARQIDPLKGLRKKAEQLQKKIDCTVGGKACPDTKPPDTKPNGKPPDGTMPPLESGPAASLDAAASLVPLAPMPPNTLITAAVSPDFAHAAGVTMKGSRMVVVVDGQEGPAFDAIEGLGESLPRAAAVFSPDGKRVAYVGKRSGQQIAVIDGKEGPPFRAIAASRPGQQQLPVLFSKNSARVAYPVEVIASVQRTPAGTAPGLAYRVVLDGVPGPEYFQIGDMLFAGEHLVYVARTNENKYLAVVDQQPLAGAPFDSVNFLMSSEDGHFAFVGMRGTSWTVVLDGVEGKVHQRPAEEFDGRTIVLSPRGGRVAYLAIGRPDNTSHNQPVNLYVDGKVRTANGFNDLTFSPDGKRLGGTVIEANPDGTQRHYAFVDEWKSLDYRTIAGGFPGQPSSTGFIFSPDSKRFALIAGNGMSVFAVVDGQESNGYLEIKNFRFSNDSRRYAFEARYPNTSGGGSVVVVDGKEGPKLREITRDSLTFSPDGSRVAYAGNVSVMEAVTVIDGAVQKAPFGAFTPRVPKGGATPPRYFAFSPDGKRLARIDQALNGSGSSVVVLDGKPQTPGYLFTMPVFTADGRHFAYAAWFNQKWLLSLDGKSMPIDGDLYEAPGSLTFQEDGSVRLLVVKDNMLSKVVVASR